MEVEEELINMKLGDYHIYYNYKLKKREEFDKNKARVDDLRLFSTDYTSPISEKYNPERE